MNLSVVIPCHNGAEYLGQTLGSLFEQSRLPDEVLVIVDNSSDSSAEIARSFGAKVRVREVKFGQASKSRNFGASLSSGDALMFLDADDVLDPFALEGLEDALRAQPEGVAFIPWSRLERHEGVWVKRPASVPRPRRGQDLLSGWLMGRYYPPCCLLWSRAAFLEVGGWSEEFCPNDDGDLAFRALATGIQFQQADKGEAFYRRIPGNESLSGKRFTGEGLSSRLRVLEKLAAWLDERRRLGDYRYPIAFACEGVRSDAVKGGFSEQRERCDAFLTEIGMRQATRMLRSCFRSAERHGRRLLAGGKNAFRGGVRRSGAAPADEEVRFGLRAAEKAARDRSAGEPQREAESEQKLPAPVVSVIIPTYNRARLTRRAIESVLKQTFQDFELLIVDDASEDDTEEVVAAVGDPRIRYLRQPVNRDVSAARNRGLREARGEFVAFLDSDDEWLPEKLEAQVKLFRRAPDSVGLVYTATIIRQDEGRERIFVPADKGNVFRKLLLNNVTGPGASSVMIRRNVIRVAGFFDEGIPAMEDYDYWIRVGRFYEFDYVRDPLVCCDDVRRADRRSRMAQKDALARNWLFAKFRRPLKSAGLAQRFILTSAHRRLSRFQSPDRLGAFALSVRAGLSNPSCSESYRTALRALFPPSTWEAIAEKARPFRDKHLARGGM